MNLKQKFKRNKGITLIALVVTIIVLLILAGVSINMLTGENGIIRRAGEAKSATEVANEKEGVQESVIVATMADSTITESNLKTALDNRFGTGKTTVEDNKDNSYTITINDSKREYTIEDDGSIFDGAYSKWDGTSSSEPTNKTSNEIHIYTVPELKWLADQVNNEGNTFENYTIYLENNLDLGARGSDDNWETSENESVKWTAIGKQKDIPLKATFEGNNHIIKGVYINDESKFNGIFGNSSSISNLTVKNSYIKAGTCSGAIVGALRSGTIENCHNINSTVESYDGETSAGGVAGQVAGVIKNCTNIGGRIVGKKTVDGASQAGGVVGALSSVSSQVINCYNTGNVTGEGSYVGGVVGTFTGSCVSSQVINCYNTGNVTGEGKYVGGVVGLAYTSSTIQGCYNTGNVTGKGNDVGGVAGGADNSLIIQGCYNTGNVTGEGKYVGGVVGLAYTSSTIQGCYNTGNVTGKGNDVGGVAGGADNSLIIQGCYNTGNVTGEGKYVGGIVGLANNIITKCYNTGNIVSNGTDGTGGIVGTCMTKIPQNISLCYNSGKVQAPESAGGISGYLGAEGYGAQEYKCYNKGKIICTTDTTGQGEIIGKTATDATITDCYYYTTDTSRYGIGTTNSGGNIETLRAGTQRTDQDFKSYDEFIKWIEK